MRVIHEQRRNLVPLAGKGLIESPKKKERDDVINTTILDQRQEKRAIII